MTIENAGNVGIGITAPTEKLSIYGNLTATGSLSAACNISLLDNGKLTLGNNKDLELYHNGSLSYIRDVGTGGLHIQTNGPAIYLQDTDGKAMAQFTDGGSNFLMYNSAIKLTTKNTGVDVTGTITSDGHTIAGNLSSNGTGIFKSLSAEDSNCCNYFAGNGMTIRSNSACNINSSIFCG